MPRRAARAIPGDVSFDILIVGQRGRLEHEAALLAVTLRHASPRWDGTLWVAEPEPGDRWPDDPRMADPEVAALLADHGARVVPFANHHFGAWYPQGNKIEALAALPEGRPFLFLDTDTVVVDELADLAIDFDRPAASMKREDTWPVPQLYGPTRRDVWAALHAEAGLDFASSEDTRFHEADWRRYLYFNAGWFLGPSGPAFGRAFLDAALLVQRAAREDGLPELASQTLDPWLDQAALPLAVHALGGGRPGQKGGIADGVLDGSHSFHWRHMPLMYATAPDHVIASVEAATRPNRIKKVLKRHEPFKRFLYQPKGWRARGLFDQSALPRREQVVRNRLKREKLWVQR